MIVQCEGCGRVRLDGEWVRRYDIQPSEVRICPTCLGWQHRIAQAKYHREARGVARRAAKGYGPAPEGEDVFKGMRGE
jgi:hypothetical protein